MKHGPRREFKADAAFTPDVADLTDRPARDLFSPVARQLTVRLADPATESVLKRRGIIGWSHIPASLPLKDSRRSAGRSAQLRRLTGVVVSTAAKSLLNQATVLV